MTASLSSIKEPSTEVSASRLCGGTRRCSVVLAAIGEMQRTVHYSVPGAGWLELTPVWICGYHLPKSMLFQAISAGDVLYLVAVLFDCGAQPVGCGEVSAAPCRFAFFGESLDLLRYRKLFSNQTEKKKHFFNGHFQSGCIYRFVRVK